MRHSDKVPWERGEGDVEVTCPGGNIVI
jgi:hypothetical protein